MYISIYLSELFSVYPKLTHCKLTIAKFKKWLKTKAAQDSFEDLYNKFQPYHPIHRI